MKKYKFSFTGRLVGAIGKTQRFTKTIAAENIKAAHLKLYDTHDHIRILSVNGKKPNKDYDIKALD